jgi:hypothetical protein
MSWNFRKVGSNAEALKASVQAEFAPPSIKDEVCARIDGLKSIRRDGEAFLVETYGHTDTDTQRPWKSVDTIVIKVYTVPVIT